MKENFQNQGGVGAAASDKTYVTAWTDVRREGTKYVTHSSPDPVVEMVVCGNRILIATTRQVFELADGVMRPLAFEVPDTKCMIAPESFVGLHPTWGGPGTIDKGW